MDKTDAAMNRMAELARLALETADIDSIRSLGEGVDHIAFEVNDVFDVRQRKRQDEHTAALVDREVRLLAVIGRASPIPVPEVVTANPALGIIVLRKLPGTSLFDDPCPDPAALVEPIARFLSCILGIPAGLVEPIAGSDACSMAAFLADAAADMSTLATALSSEDRRIVEAFLGTSPPPESGVTRFCHNDLGAEHLLASPDRLTLTGVIDWSDAAVTDPARDLGRIYRDLGPAVAAALLARLDLSHDDDILKRAAFHARCALIEDLAFGMTSGGRRYADQALAHLRRTFGASPCTS